MKHAYLILAHNQFDILYKLIDAIDDVRNDIYIHFDKKVDNIPVLKTNYSKIFILNDRIKVYWADISIVEAEFKLFEYANNQYSYDYYHLLSGVDMPIKSQDFIHNFFERNYGKEFIGFFQNDNSKTVQKRIKYYHIFPQYLREESGFKPRLIRYLRSFVLRLQMICGICRNKNLNYRKGTQWVSVTNAFIVFVLSNKDAILKQFRYTFAPDEFFIQTYCWNSIFRDSVYSSSNEGLGSLRAVAWENNVIKDWSIKDFDDLKKSDALFARKFNSDSIDIVDLLLNFVTAKRS